MFNTSVKKVIKICLCNLKFGKNSVRLSLRPQNGILEGLIESRPLDIVYGGMLLSKWVTIQ